MKSNNSIKQFCFLLIHRKQQKPAGLKDIDTSASSATGERAGPTGSTPDTQSPEGVSGLNGEGFSKEETAIWERLFR